MTEPPPWARPDPSAAPAPVPVRPETLPEPDPEPQPEPPPLFPSRAETGEPMLFPGGAARPRPSRDLPEVPRTGRRVGTGEPGGQAGTGPPPGRRPPSMRPPDAPPQHVVIPPADPDVGVLAGPIGETRSRRSYPGFVILIAAAVLATASVIGRSLVGGAPFALAIVPGMLVAVVWVVRRTTGAGADPSVPVRRFRLQPADGRTAHFLIDGEIEPGVLRPGALVRVHGRGERDGHTVARTVDVLATLDGPVVRQVTGRKPRAVVAAGVLSWASIALAGLLLAGAAVVIGGAG
jgi:hypothetical protein